MDKRFVTFGFGDSYFSVINIIISKIQFLHLWGDKLLLIYSVCIPLNKQSSETRTSFDAVSSAIVLFAYAIPGPVMAIALQPFWRGSFASLFPIRGLTSIILASLLPCKIATTCGI
jgi:ABC-type microcin C transport system permease subunit YejB